MTIKIYTTQERVDVILKQRWAYSSIDTRPDGTLIDVSFTFDTDKAGLAIQEIYHAGIMVGLSEALETGMTNI